MRLRKCKILVLTLLWSLNITRVEAQIPLETQTPDTSAQSLINKINGIIGHAFPVNTIPTELRPTPSASASISSCSFNCTLSSNGSSLSSVESATPSVAFSASNTSITFAALQNVSSFPTGKLSIV